MKLLAQETEQAAKTYAAAVTLYDGTGLPDQQDMAIVV